MDKFPSLCPEKGTYIVEEHIKDTFAPFTNHLITVEELLNDLTDQTVLNFGHQMISTLSDIVAVLVKRTTNVRWIDLSSNNIESFSDNWAALVCLTRVVQQGVVVMVGNPMFTSVESREYLLPFALTMPDLFVKIIWIHPDSLEADTWVPILPLANKDLLDKIRRAHTLFYAQFENDGSSG